MKLFYREYGSGSPFVILHGLLGAGGNWHTLARRVFSNRYRVFAIDQRNHGESPHNDRIDYDSMAEDLARFLDEQGFESCTLLGHSMGGKTAMRFALAHPARVDRLVVVDIAPRASHGTHEDILRALAELDLSTITRRTEADSQLAATVESLTVRQFLLKNLRYQLHEVEPDAGEFVPEGIAIWPNDFPQAARHFRYESQEPFFQRVASCSAPGSFWTGHVLCFRVTSGRRVPSFTGVTKAAEEAERWSGYGS